RNSTRTRFTAHSQVLLRPRSRSHIRLAKNPGHLPSGPNSQSRPSIGRMLVANGASRTRRNSQKFVSAYATHTKSYTSVVDFVFGVTILCVPLVAVLPWTLAWEAQAEN
ncbi:hypothetical protein T265_13419, partial [Opisthorchis viverrini]